MKEDIPIGTEIGPNDIVFRDGESVIIHAPKVVLEGNVEFD